MERRKFLKGVAVLAVLPIVGVAEELGVDSMTYAEAIDTFGVKEIDMTHLVKVNKNRRSYHEKFVVSMDINSMYMMEITPITPIGA